MSDAKQSGRFEESHNLKHGVVQDSVDLPAEYRPEETTVTVTEWPNSDHYALTVPDPLHLGDATVLFDTLSYSDGTLWFIKATEDGNVTTGCIDWHLLSAGTDYGLVGEWFRDQLDLDPYRTGAKCPECGSEILNDELQSACENLDCDVHFEGVPGDSWETIERGGDGDDA